MARGRSLKTVSGTGCPLLQRPNPRTLPNSHQAEVLAAQHAQHAGWLCPACGALPIAVAAMRPLELCKPFLNILPEVPHAERKIPFKDKGLYTAVALFVFLVCSQLPLYGIRTNSGSDPFYWARVIMASNRCLPPLL